MSPLRLPATGQKIGRQSEQQNDDADRTIAGVPVDRIAYDYPRDKHEYSSSEGMPRNSKTGSLGYVRGLRPSTMFSSSKDKNAGGGKPEEQKVHRDHVVENLLVMPRDRNSRSPNALQYDGDYRDMSPAVDRPYTAEENTILRHCKVNAGSSQNRLTKESQRGN